MLLIAGYWPIWAASETRTELLPVTVTAEPDSVMAPEAIPVVAPSGSIHIELPGRALVSIARGNHQ